MRRIAGVLVLLLGILSLVHGGFSYTEETHDADLGLIQFQVKEKKRVNIPVWAGILGVVAGGAMVIIPARAGGAGT